MIDVVCPSISNKSSFHGVISGLHLKSLRKMTSIYSTPSQAYLQLHGLLRISNTFCSGERGKVLAQFPGPATKMFRILPPPFFIKSRRAPANTIGCTGLFVSTCNAHCNHWQWFLYSHSPSAFTRMTSIWRVSMRSIVALASCIFQIVHIKSWMDFGVRLTKKFARSFLPADFCSQAFVILCQLWYHFEQKTKTLPSWLNVVFCFAGFLIINCVHIGIVIILFIIVLFNFSFSTLLSVCTFLVAGEPISCRSGWLGLLKFVDPFYKCSYKQNSNINGTQKSLVVCLRSVVTSF